MNWEAVGTVAETIAAIGVIVTLFYLARQIRESNVNDRVSANQEVGRDYASHLSTIMADENIASFIKGLNSYADLTPEERYKFDFCMAGYLNIAEVIIYHHEGSRMFEELDMITGNFGPRVFAYPGAREWWEHGHKEGFADSTKEWVDLMFQEYQGTPGFWQYQDSVKKRL